MATPKEIKEYWNEDYYKYWQEVTKENCGSDVPKKDACFTFFKEMGLSKKDKILEVGCGFGRLFPYFLSNQAEFYGIDVSPQMILRAKKDFPEFESKISVGDAEELNFPNAFFSKIFCWGVFDSLVNQETALKEFARVLSPGGLMIISAKHKPYLEEDKEAKIAEINAAKKNHPNTFINLPVFKEWLLKNNLHIQKQFFFLKRGDLSKRKIEFLEPEKFYEFVFILKKNE